MMVNRITDFAKGGEDGDGYSYQSVQARIAVAKGGLMGSGPGNSTQRNFLPHPYSDFIYAIVIEEYGLGRRCFHHVAVCGDFVPGRSDRAKEHEEGSVE